jgi:hypothetical protein
VKETNILVMQLERQQNLQVCMKKTRQHWKQDEQKKTAEK